MERAKSLPSSSKATAILVGYISEYALLGKAYDPARDFSDLLARITSPDNKTREDAKTRIRELATRGGWTARAQTEPRPEKMAAAPQPMRGKPWLPEDDSALKEQWLSPAEPSAKELAKFFGRSDGAIFARLVKIRLYQNRNEARAADAARKARER